MSDSRMVTLILEHDDGSPPLELHAQDVEIHATIDGARIVYTEDTATKITWTSNAPRRVKHEGEA